MEKIRDTKTGGKPTYENEYLLFEFDWRTRRFLINGVDPFDNIDNKHELVKIQEEKIEEKLGNDELPF